MSRMQKRLGRRWRLLGLALALIVVLATYSSWAADLTIDGGATYTVNSNLTFNSVYIGNISTGTLNQGSFMNTITGSLFLGYNPGGSGAYNLSGGNLSTTWVETAGYYGSGVFNQSGGSNATGNLNLGYGTGSSGTFNQIDGINTISGILFLGNNPGSSGAYNLSGGSLSAGFEYIGHYGLGAFTQSGGTNTIDRNLYLGGYPGSSGSYNLSDGNLLAARQFVGYYGSGIFNQSGGSNTIEVKDIYSGLELGYWQGSFGTYNLSSGSLTAPYETIGVYGDGTFNQSNGTNQVTRGLTLGLGNGNSGSGTYNLSGGNLSADSQCVGYNGTGTFNQSGGNNTVAGDLALGYHFRGVGVYNLSGGSLSTTNTIIGASGTGTFNQTGGSHSVRDTLTLGIYAGSSGVYNLQGGSLIVGTVNLNAGGAFNQTGGSLNAATFNQQGGTVDGSLENRGTFTYLSGLFAGRLLNYGAVNLNADFTAANGLANYSSTSLVIASGRTVTLDGQGLDNLGNLVVNGTLTGSGPLLNDYSGLLSGSGLLAGSFINRGAVNPGGSVGTLNVSGSFTQTAAGNFFLEVSSPASYDRLSVTGPAILSGRLSPVLLGGYRPQPNQVFPGFFNATGSISGSFSYVGNFTPTLIGTPLYSANSIDLMVKRDYTNPELGLNSNQAAVGAMFNGLAGITSGDLGAVLNAADNLPTGGGVQDAFKQISPEKAGAMATLGFAGATFQMRNLASRTTNLRFTEAGSSDRPGNNSGSLGLNYSRGAGVMLAYNGAALPGLLSARRDSRMPETAWGLFADGGAAFGSQKSTANQTGFDFTLGGFTAGGDYRLRDHLLLGLATGYSHTAAGFRDSGGSVTANTLPVNAYAAYFPGSFYAYGSLGYALNLFDLERGLNFGGLSRTAASSTTGHQFNAYGETGYDLRFWRYIITPTATLAYSHLWVNAFTEQDAGALNLKVASQEADSLQMGLGGRLTLPFTVGQVKVVPQTYASYQHEFSDGSRGLNASLSQFSSPFNFQTDAAKRNFAVLGATLAAGLKNNLWAQANYNVEVGRGNYTAHYLTAGLRYQF
jgi:uncharacterized protein with beta-barrel porin domain